MQKINKFNYEIHLPSFHLPSFHLPFYSLVNLL